VAAKKPNADFVVAQPTDKDFERFIWKQFAKPQTATYRPTPNWRLAAIHHNGASQTP